jgi:hypothetical protein
MGWGTLIGQRRFLLRGSTAQARYGDLNRRAHFFMFYLPNARFQRENVIGQGNLLKYVRAVQKGKSWEKPQGSELL